MQTAETFTLATFLKLLLLFVLLITGVMLKTTEMAPTANAKNVETTSSPSTLEPDSTHIQRLYFLMVTNEASSAAL